MEKTMRTGNFTYNNETYDFNFTTSLLAHEKRLFVRTVIDNIIDENNYDAVIRDLVFDFVIIEMFTNIDTSFINVKDNDDKLIDPIIIVEHFLEETNIVDTIKANMKDGLLDELNHAIDLNIQYITGICPNPLNEALARFISTLENKVNDIDLDSMAEVAKALGGISEDFTIDNIVKAYMNTDIAKDNQKEIVKSKSKK